MQPLDSELLSRGAIVYLDPLTLPVAPAGCVRQLMAAARAAGFSRISLLSDGAVKSGAKLADQPGFRKLTAAVCGDGPGAVFVADVLRLASNGPPWRRFIDLCALSSALLIDLTRAYDPRRSAHRMLLGLASSRLVPDPLERRPARTSARASAIVTTSTDRTPSGSYGPWRVDATAARAAALEHLFSIRLRHLGSIHAVVSWAREAGLRVPVAARDTREPRISWEVPSLRSVSQLLGVHPELPSSDLSGAAPNSRLGRAPSKLERARARPR